MGTTQGAATAVTVSAGMDARSRAELSEALTRLQGGGGLVMRMADMVGGVVGRTVRMGTRAFDRLPGGPAVRQGVVEAALRRAFELAVLRLGHSGEPARSRRLAGPLVMISGAVGGFVGLGGFVPDAAVTTLAIMREIARIAVEQGEALDDPGTRAACLEVFALNPGGAAPGPESEMGYFGARMALQGRPLALLLSEVAGGSGSLCRRSSQCRRCRWWVRSAGRR